MKIQKILSALCVIMVMTVISCKEDLSSQVRVGSTIAPTELQALSAPSYVFTFPQKDQTFETFKWSQADFGFQSSITYRVQIDKGTGDFSSPITLVSVLNTLSASVTKGDVNTKMLGLGLAPSVASNVKFRVLATVNDKATPSISNERTVSITPYPVIFDPIWGMGDAINGWGPWLSKEIEVPATEYNKYETYGYFTQGKIFRFFVQQDWGPNAYNYTYFTTVDPDLALNSGDSDNNFKVVSATGWYDVKVDLTNKTVVFNPMSEPTLYMVGDGIPAAGWGWNTPIKFTFKKPGVFESPSTAFDPAGAFRFFGQNDWAPVDYKYTYFTNGVDAKFKNANDNDSNLKLNVAATSLKLKVDLTGKKVTVLP